MLAQLASLGQTEFAGAPGMRRLLFHAAGMRRLRQAMRSQSALFSFGRR